MECSNGILLHTNDCTDTLDASIRRSKTIYGRISLKSE